MTSSDYWRPSVHAFFGEISGLLKEIESLNTTPTPPLVFVVSDLSIKARFLGKTQYIDVITIDLTDRITSPSLNLSSDVKDFFLINLPIKIEGHVDILNTLKVALENEYLYYGHFKY